MGERVGRGTSPGRPSRWGRRQSRRQRSKRGRGPVSLHQRTGSLRKKNTRKVSSRVCFGFSSVCLPIKKWPARRQLCGFHSVKRIRGKFNPSRLSSLAVCNPRGRRDPAAPARASSSGGGQTRSPAPPAGGGPRGGARLGGRGRFPPGR